LFAAFPFSPAYASSSDVAGIEPVLRFRGGPSFEEKYQGTGPAWFAGASAGILVAHTLTATVGMDRISLDATRAATPLTLQVELSRPFQRWITPRLYGGWGAYLVQTVRTSDLDFFGAPPHGGDPRTETYWGSYVGAGLSLRITGGTMFDLGLRLQRAGNRYQVPLSLDTIDTGFTFRL
jgi:hypothetical protein